jgi:hypothetical protein
MKLKEKIAIVAAAVALSVAGFNLIAGPTVDILKVGHQAGYEIIANYLAKGDASRAVPKG